MTAPVEASALPCKVVVVPNATAEYAMIFPTKVELSAKVTADPAAQNTLGAMAP